MGAIVPDRNEKTGEHFEVGYMLENTLLQANNLGIFYKSKIFEQDECTRALENEGYSWQILGLRQEGIWKKWSCQK